jgi:hypothetical protein
MKKMPRAMMPMTANPPTAPPTMAPTGAPPPPESGGGVVVVLAVVLVVEGLVGVEVVASLVEVVDVGVVETGGEGLKISCPEKIARSQLNKVKTWFGLALVAHRKVTQ